MEAFGWAWWRAWVDGPPAVAPGLFVDFGALVLLLVAKERGRA